MTRLALALAAILAAAPVAAEVAPGTYRSNVLCGPTAEVQAVLTGQYREAPAGGGITEAGQFVALWSNAETGTWTVTLAHPDGWSCMLASGEAGWETVAAPPPGEEG